jgi:hypothetical protein
MYRAVESEAADFNPDLVYMRYTFFEPRFLGCLKQLKGMGAHTVLEIPTYPYDQEYADKPLFKQLFLYVDRFFRKRLSGKIDLIVSPYGPYENIFNVPSILVSNGIDLNQMPLAESPEKLSPFVMIGIGNLSVWHAYDRILKGLKNLNNEQRVNFKLIIVGKGPELERYEQLVSKYQLKPYVQFTGMLQGIELDSVFNRVHLGLGSLGMHRLLLNSGNSLKNKEFCARGLPFVISAEDTDFPSHFPYIWRVSADESPIDPLQLKAQYAAIMHGDFRNEMRAFAEENLSWLSRMQVVLDCIQKQSANIH